MHRTGSCRNRLVKQREEGSRRELEARITNSCSRLSELARMDFCEVFYSEHGRVQYETAGSTAAALQHDQSVQRHDALIRGQHDERIDVDGVYDLPEIDGQTPERTEHLDKSRLVKRLASTISSKQFGELRLGNHVLRLCRPDRWHTKCDVLDKLE